MREQKDRHLGSRCHGEHGQAQRNRTDARTRAYDRRVDETVGVAVAVGVIVPVSMLVTMVLFDGWARLVNRGA